MTRDGLLIVGINLLPLVGAIVAGWDGMSILMLYWLETAVIGFWTIWQTAASPSAPLGGRPVRQNLIGLAAFLTLHAGIFMAVHLFLLLSLFGESQFGFTVDPRQLIWDLVVNRGLWAPLLALFIVRATIAFVDWRAGVPTGPVIVTFYIRIVVMQFTVLLGGWVLLIALPFGLDHSVAGVALLVALKTFVEFKAAGFVGRLSAAITERAEQQQPSDGH